MRVEEQPSVHDQKTAQMSEELLPVHGQKTTQRSEERTLVHGQKNAQRSEEHIHSIESACEGGFVWQNVAEMVDVGRQGRLGSDAVESELGLVTGEYREEEKGSENGFVGIKAQKAFQIPHFCKKSRKSKSCGGSHPGCRDGSTSRQGAQLEGPGASFPS